MYMPTWAERVGYGAVWKLREGFFEIEKVCALRSSTVCERLFHMWALLTDLDGIPLTCVEPTTAYFGISNLG